MGTYLQGSDEEYILDSSGGYIELYGATILGVQSLSHGHTLATITADEDYAYRAASSWFIEQTKAKESDPVVRFTMAGSDHSSRVIKWPTIRRDAEKFTPLNIGIQLSNADGLYNSFYSQIYTINTSCSIDVGFTHPTSGYEYVRVYTGKVQKVSYPDQANISLSLYDKIYDLSQIKVGQSDAPASFTSQIPSDIAWTLCTSYGNFSSTQSSANLDIDYESFQKWSASFSQDNVVATAIFKGTKVTEALAAVADHTDSYVWVDGWGKIVFERFTENSSTDFTLEEGQYSSIKMNIDNTRVVNRQYVSYNYSISSDYWQNQLSAVNTTSVNSFGVQDNIFESSKIWYTNSSHASNIANRRVSRWGTPPRNFEIDVPLFGIDRKPIDMIRFVNSFFTVTSATGWRISAQEVTLDPKKIKVRYKTNEGFVANAFYLDVSELDGDHKLL